VNQALWCLRPGVVALLGVSLPVLAADPVQLESVVVTGARGSASSAQERKRLNEGIVDAVVASDIHKLPDLSVSEAVQRVTGVQIVRDRGEGSVVTVRGLTQVETTLNGREVFTAGNERTLNFADISADMVTGIDVYKTSSADRIEGGLGGSIDLRTRHPFDFSGDATVLSARSIRGDLVDRNAEQFSALLSRRWATEEGGAFGALVNVSVQNRAWREDQKSNGSLALDTRPVPGQDVVTPNGTSETTSEGRRRRSAVSLLLQWRPTSDLEFYTEAHYVQLKTRQDSQQINVTAGTGVVPGSVTLFPGTNDLRSITWTDSTVSILSFARDTVDRTRQLAVGGGWRDDPLTISGDLSYTKSINQLYFSGPIFAATAAQFTHDMSGRVPETSVSGTNLLDPANIRYTGVAYRTLPLAGDLAAARLDGERRLDGSFFERVSAGWRYAQRRADNEPGLVFADTSLTGLTAADTPGRVMPNPYGDFLAGQAGSIGSYLVGDLSGARNGVDLRNSFGITQPIPAGGDPLSVWHIKEQTHALYVAGAFQAIPNELDGQVGLRVVHTRESVTGTQAVPSTSATAPIAIDSGYTDWLPSLTLRHHVDAGLVLRAAASRTVTRPTFDQLSPSLRLTPNSVDPTQNAGSSGNPDLRPMRSTNIDLAIERHVGRAHSASMTVFWKRVNGFIATHPEPEFHNGATYSVTRPYNNDTGDIRGAEFAYQRFFDFLPGAWRGLGLQANYTYVDGRIPDRFLGPDADILNLSRHSANLIGIYEHGPVVARVAYNWRSKFRSGSANTAGIGSYPIYTYAYGWLDASFGYRINDKLTVTLEGANLLKTLRRSYYGAETRPQSAWVNDRQLAVSFSVQF
jgi:iron complex outermembrane receptor protein